LNNTSNTAQTTQHRSPVVTRRADSLGAAYPATAQALQQLEHDIERIGGLAELGRLYGCSRQAAWSLLKARRRAVDTAAG